MRYVGIVITGTSGVGKSTIAKKLCEKFNTFQRVPVVTTRKPRVNNGLDLYRYLTNEEFEKLNKENKLLVKSEHQGEKYGIVIDDFKAILSNNKVPVLVLTPESAKQLDESSNEYNKFLIIFLDASDDTLNRRLTERGEEINEYTLKQRDIDRRYKDEIFERSDSCIYILEYNDNVSPDEVTQLIQWLWEHRNCGGLLPERIIKLMIKCGMLLKNADLNNVSGASYDLTLGDIYWQDGEKKMLDDKNSFITLKPGDYAIVSSKEIVCFPKDIAGRFDLAVSLFCQGIILSNGPQVDPGFNGRLFCLLFNTSNDSIELKRGQHYATIEFIKLLEPTRPYSGKYQGKIDIIDYLPKPAKPSSIVKLWENVNKLQSARWWERTLPIILSIIALVISIVIAIWSLFSH